MADEYIEVEMIVIEDPVDSSQSLLSDYDPTSDSDDSVNNFDLDSDSEGPIEKNPGEIINGPVRSLNFRWKLKVFELS